MAHLGVRRLCSAGTPTAVTRMCSVLQHSQYNCNYHRCQATHSGFTRTTPHHRTLADDNNTARDGENAAVVYTGPFAGVVRILKSVSVSTTFLAVGFTPLSLLFETDMPTSAKLVLGGTISTFALASTGIVHWVTKPYVRLITCRPQDAELLGPDRETVYDEAEAAGEEPDPSASVKAAIAADPDGNVPPPPDILVNVETLNFFARPMTVTVPMSELVWPEFPLAFVSFEDVKGKGYFVHPEIVEADPRLANLFPKIIADVEWQRGGDSAANGEDGKK